MVTGKYLIIIEKLKSLYPEIFTIKKLLMYC